MTTIVIIILLFVSIIISINSSTIQDFAENNKKFRYTLILYLNLNSERYIIISVSIFVKSKQ